MSGSQRAVAGVTSFVVTVEHASNEIPDAYGGLGLTPEDLASHVAWDPGARELGRRLARDLGAALFEGRWSRLVIDLNRSRRHPRWIPKRSFGLEVPGNRGLDAAEIVRRDTLHYEPFRSAALDAARAAVERGGCVHLSVHSFAPEVAGRRREADLGVLYDPRRGRESALAAAIQRGARELGARVRRNYPYRGVSDGHATALRKLFPDPLYAGLEIELNQGSALDVDALSRTIGDALAICCSRR